MEFIIQQYNISNDQMRKSPRLSFQQHFSQRQHSPMNSKENTSLMRQQSYRQNSINKNEKKFDNIVSNSRQKYDSYTPRKRYIKERQEYNNYYHQEKSSLNISRCRYNMNLSQKQKVFNNKFCYQNLTSSPLKDKTSYFSNNNNFQNIYPPYNQNKFQFENQISKKLRFDHNDLAKNKIEEKKCITPKKETNQLTQKMSMIQTKLAKLQRMTPRQTKFSRMANSTITTIPIQNKFQKEQFEWNNEKQSQTKIDSLMNENKGEQDGGLSLRQSEIMSGISLGRLVQYREEECQNEIELIQDLSYRISSKLQSIIRNFG